MQYALSIDSSLINSEYILLILVHAVIVVGLAMQFIDNAFVLFQAEAKPTSSGAVGDAPNPTGSNPEDDNDPVKKIIIACIQIAFGVIIIIGAIKFGSNFMKQFGDFPTGGGGGSSTDGFSNLTPKSDLVKNPIPAPKVTPNTLPKLNVPKSSTPVATPIVDAVVSVVEEVSKNKQPKN